MTVRSPWSPWSVRSFYVQRDGGMASFSFGVETGSDSQVLSNNLNPGSMESAEELFLANKRKSRHLVALEKLFILKV